MTQTSNGKAEAASLDDFICFAIYSANHALNRVYKPLLDAIGLTYTQYIAMITLWERDDQTVGSLGETLFLESSTLTPVLKRLEGLGLIARARDKTDERQVRVQLTAAGRALQERARSIPACILDASGLEADELTRLKAEIATLRSSLLR
jgi:DNA-binding MarR family transcriptional regulator